MHGIKRGSYAFLQGYPRNLEEDNMKKRVISLLLVMMMLLAVLPVTALADAADNIKIQNATYHANGSLKSINATFDWTSGGVSDARLTLMSKKLNGGTSGNWGDFTNFGKYAAKFKSFDDAKAEDESTGVFGFITYSGAYNFSMNSKYTVTLNIAESDIPMNVDGIYYVYLWVKYSGKFYPDNLICAIQVKGGQLQYSVGDASQGRNHYDPMNFKVVDDEDAPTNTHTCLKSGWLWDDNGHWRRGCQDSTCANYTTKVDAGKHVYTDDYDTTCNSCGYTRTAPAQHPETGDITHIPMWTMLFLGAMAMMWVQLTQRKREQF